MSTPLHPHLDEPLAERIEELLARYVRQSVVNGQTSVPLSVLIDDLQRALDGGRPGGARPRREPPPAATSGALRPAAS